MGKKITKDSQEKKPEVVQLAVGGTPSSGKTVLIDSLFSFMDSNTNVPYMPADFFNFHVKPDKSYFYDIYDSYEQLMDTVNRNFHLENATRDSGHVSDNTHTSILFESGKEKFIFLVRNIPGEMFEAYFSTKFTNGSQGQNSTVLLKTFYQYFLEFSSKTKGLSSFKSFFKEPDRIRKIKEAEINEAEIKKEKNASTKAVDVTTDSVNDSALTENISPSEVDLTSNGVNNNDGTVTEIKRLFLSYLTTIDSRADWNTAVGSGGILERNFYAFLYYITSDHFVYCIDVQTRRSNEDEMIISSSIDVCKMRDKSYYCFTKFDSMISHQRLLPLLNNFDENLLKKEEPEGPYTEKLKKACKTVWQGLVAKFRPTNRGGRDVASEGLLSESISMCLDNLDLYWKLMRFCYFNIENRNTDFLDAARLANFNNLYFLLPENNKKNDDIKIFYTSVAYCRGGNKEEDRGFVPFQPEAARTAESNSDVETGDPHFNYWHKRINRRRVPLGVLELLLSILIECGMEFNKFNASLSYNETENTIIIKRITNKQS